MQEVFGLSMSDDLANRLKRLLPNGRGVWIPMDHGLSGYPENGLDRMNSVIDSVIDSFIHLFVLSLFIHSFIHSFTQ